MEWYDWKWLVDYLTLYYGDITKWATPLYPLCDVYHKVIQNTLQIFYFFSILFQDINVSGSDGALPIHYAAKYFKKDKHVAISMSAPVEETGNVEKAILEVGTVASGFSKYFPRFSMTSLRRLFEYWVTWIFE